MFTGTQTDAWVGATQPRPGAGPHRVFRHTGAGAQRDQGRLSLKLLVLAPHVSQE